MSYLVTKYIPYEGEYSISLPTLEAVKEYIKDEGSLADWSDYEIIEITRCINIYELMQEPDGTITTKD